MLADVPRPEFDHMAAGVGHVSGAPATVAVPRVVVVKDGVAPFSKPIDNGVVGLSRQPHRIVDVHAAAPSAQPDLRPPQADASSVRGHHPDRFVGPALDHGKAKDPGIEFLGRRQVSLLERDLAHSIDWNCVIAVHDLYFPAESTTDDCSWRAFSRATSPRSRGPAEPRPRAPHPSGSLRS